MRRASNRNVMAWTFMGNTRMHQVLREKGNKLSHVGIFTFEVSADGTISETGTAVSTILPYVKKWPHIKWLLTIMNHGIILWTHTQGSPLSSKIQLPLAFPLALGFLGGYVYHALYTVLFRGVYGGFVAL